MRSYRAIDLTVLWLLIVINIFVFLMTLFDQRIVYFLGLTPMLLSRQPWTIITNMFVHGDFTHILFNMISLYFLGSFLIRAAGQKGFLTVYFLGGLAGNILFILLADPRSTGIGASGAIYALGGTLAVMVPRMPVFIFPIPVPVPLWAAIIIFLLLSFRPGIAWQAHLGGFLLGFIAGLILKGRPRTYQF